MRFPRALAGCSALALFSLSLAARSRAELLVVTSPGTPPALAHAEVAFATGLGEPVSWLSLRIRRGPVAVIAALPDAASCEPALDAWFKALERTVSPNVLLPADATDCGKSSSFVHVDWPRSRGVGAEELTLTTAEDVAATLEEHGLNGDLTLPAAARYIVWAWAVAEGDETTRTLRVTGASAPLSFVPASNWPVLVSVLSPGPQAWQEELETDQLRVTFVAGKPATDYLAQLEKWLQRERGPLLEARGAGAIFGWSILSDTVSLPPLVRSYARDAANERDDVDFERCSEQLQAFQQGEVPSATACGSATDAALAVAAAGPGPVLQRWVVPGSAPIRVDSLRDGGEPLPAVLRARSVDSSACPDVVVVPPIVLPPTSGGGAGPIGRGGGAAVVVEDETVVVQEPCQSDGCGSCSPGRDPYYEDRRTTVYCAGDSSSTAGDGSCSSDSSSSSDDSCSSDSSSSSDDSCSSDSSSSSDDSCSGSSDSSYDGDTCTGRAAPGAEPSAAQSRLTNARATRPQRLRLSLWSLGLAALLLPIRRRKRERVR